MLLADQRPEPQYNNISPLFPLCLALLGCKVLDPARRDALGSLDGQPQGTVPHKLRQNAHGSRHAKQNGVVAAGEKDKVVSSNGVICIQIAVFENIDRKCQQRNVEAGKDTSGNSVTAYGANQGPPRRTQSCNYEGEAVSKAARCSFRGVTNGLNYLVAA